MQTACWQLWFSDRFTGARNPARLPTTIQSRRIRYAPIAKRGWDRGPTSAPTSTFYHPPDLSISRRPPTPASYNVNMRNRRAILCVLGVPALLLLATTARAADMTQINIVVKTPTGKPVDRASVVVRFIEGRSV